MKLHDLSLPSKIFQKLRNWIDTRYEQVIAGSGAGDVQEMTFCVVEVFNVCVIADGSDAFFERNDVIIAGHNADAAKLEALRSMHRCQADTSETAPGNVGRFSDGIACAG